MLPIAAMARNYGIKCGLFVPKMLAVNFVARVFWWKASLAQNFVPHNHNQASSPESKEAYPQEVTRQKATRPRHHVQQTSLLCLCSHWQPLFG
jgi:hypothetical protein